MIRLGLTGTVGAGKSTVARWFEEWGGWRIDADALAREVVAPGTPALQEIRRTFGEGVIRADGTLDRAALRAVVFADPAARERLEAIVHPAIDRRRVELLRDAGRAGARVVVLEIPLLFEKDISDECDVVVTVDAPPEVRRARVAAARGLSSDEFAAIDAAQWSGERKRRSADYAIVNDGDLETLRSEARAIWDEVLAGAGPELATIPWCADLHMHTSASHDCRSEPAAVVDRARELGLDRIAITDHNEIDGALAAREIAPQMVIVGEEVRTAEGLDLIGLFLRRRIAPRGAFREVAEAIRAQGGIVYLPHPFDRFRGTTETFLQDVEDCIDAVEGFNARVHDRGRNAKAVAWAAARGLPVGAGSDAHLVREIGRGVVRLPPFEGRDGFLPALARGRIEGRPSNPLVHLGSTWAKLRKRWER